MYIFLAYTWFIQYIDITMCVQLDWLPSHTIRNEIYPILNPILKWLVMAQILNV